MSDFQKALAKMSPADRAYVEGIYSGLEGAQEVDGAGLAHDFETPKGALNHYIMMKRKEKMPERRAAEKKNDAIRRQPPRDVAKAMADRGLRRDAEEETRMMKFTSGHIEGPEKSPEEYQDMHMRRMAREIPWASNAKGVAAQKAAEKRRKDAQAAQAAQREAKEAEDIYNSLPGRSK